MQASPKKNEKAVYQNRLDKTRTIKPIFKLGGLVGTADKKFFSEGGSSKQSCNLYTITEIFSDTIQVYHMKKLPERYNDELLKKSVITMI